VALVALQSLAVGAAALGAAGGDHESEPVAGAALVLKAIVVAVLLGHAVARTRQPRPIGDDAAPALHAVLMIAAMFAVVALVPTGGLESPTEVRGGLALVAAGLVIAVARRATLFQLLGLLVIENGVAVAALGAERGLPTVVELGVAFDLTIIVAVAVAFQSRILGAFGTTDAEAMRGLRD